MANLREKSFTWSIDGTPCAVKVARTVWSEGKLRNDFKKLSITMFSGQHTHGDRSGAVGIQMDKIQELACGFPRIHSIPHCVPCGTSLPAYRPKFSVLTVHFQPVVFFQDFQLDFQVLNFRIY